MKLQDIDFRIVEKKNDKGNYSVCGREDCPCNQPFIYGNEAKSRMSEEDLQDCKIEFWTGLIDSDGLKIYEGDILEITNHRFKDTIEVVVIWRQGGFFMKVIKTYDEDEVYIGKEIPFSEVHSYSQQIDLVVTGNIHENPELLEIEK